MKTIETAIFPLTFVLCMCGLCVFEYPQGRPKLYLTILYILISWLLYIYLVVQTITFVGLYHVEFPPVHYFTIITTSIFMVLNIYYYKRFKGCLKKLNIVNDTLGKLGTLKNLSQLRARAIWVIVGWIISIFVLTITDSMYLYEKIPKSYAATSICLQYIINHSMHIGTLCEITFLTLLRYIGTLFEYVNLCIQTLIEQKKEQIRLARTTSTSSYFIHRHLVDTSQSDQFICLLMHAHFELSSISRELSIVFGPQMLMQLTVFHFSAMQYIIELHGIIIRIKIQFTYENGIDFISILIWFVRCILSIIIFNYICEGVCTKANQVETFLNRLANITFDVKTQENIMQFLLEIVRRPLKISGFGFYDYGYKLIHKFIERAVKIIIIVIQAR